MPTFSIITATFNSEKFIARAAKALLEQTYADYEWIVQDGKSVDKTVSILEQYGDSRIKVVSEKDSGIYDAWNKAVARASGDWFIFLGADDCLFTPTVLEQCEVYLSRLDDGILFAYGATFLGNNGLFAKLINPSISEAFSLFSSEMSIPFPATFVRGSLFSTSQFDASYTIAADFDLVARFASVDTLVRISVLVSYMEHGGVSNSAQSLTKIREEQIRVLENSVALRADSFVHGYVATIADKDVSLDGFIVDKKLKKKEQLFGFLPVDAHYGYKGKVKYKLFGRMTVFGIRHEMVYLFNSIRTPKLNRFLSSLHKAAQNFAL